MTERIGIVGLGHIGASLLRRLVLSDREVVGYDADEGTRARAREDGYEVFSSVRDVAERATHLVLALPTPEIERTVKEVAGLVRSHSIPPLLLSDVASVKSTVVKVVTEIVGGVEGLEYLSLHPMAGREGSGYETSDPGIFGGRIWIAIASPETTPDAFARASELVSSCGDALVVMDAVTHDDVVALVSHLPHVISFVYFSLVTENPLWPIAARIGAGSFSDMVRVSRSNPGRVREMVVPNSAHLDPLLEELCGRLEDARRALRSAVGDDDSLQRVFPLRLAQELGVDHTLEPECSVVLKRAELVSELLRYGMEGRSITAIEATGDGDGFSVSLR